MTFQERRRQRRELVKQHYYNCESLRELAEVTGLTQAKVRMDLIALGLPTKLTQPQTPRQVEISSNRRLQKKITPVDLEIVAMYGAGHSLKEIAEATGLKYATAKTKVYRLINRFGMDVRQPNLK